MKNGKLILHPAPPAAIPGSITDLITGLQDIGFLASPLEAAPDTRYLAGDRFLQLITFLGCSPQIQLEPPEGGSLDFCHVSLSGPSGMVRFVAGSMSAPPRCPRCRSKNAAWEQMIEAWHRDRAGFRWTCPSCGAASEVSRLNWRQGAGFGRFFLEIQNIFPGEAVPGDELLRTLEASTDTPWVYFYATS
jgi:hypothetical protein